MSSFRTPTKSLTKSERMCSFGTGMILEIAFLRMGYVFKWVLNGAPKELIPSYFTYADGCYQQTGAIPVIKNKADLRQELYENGFVCDGIKYVRYKRSAGSTRLVSACLSTRLLRREWHAGIDAVCQFVKMPQ